MPGSSADTRTSHEASAPPDLSERVRDVHRRFATGITVVTTAVDGVPYGLVVNAFSSISLSPPLVLVCVAETTSTYERLFGGEHFAVNILARDQVDVAMRFARSGGDKFAGLPWRPGRHGSPIIDGVAAALELSVETRLPAYTHTIFIGRVLEAQTADHAPLIYLDTRFYDGAQLTPAG
jgi:flavin reductase (DIM6/NTAB) family NADH-FMN oxidoreductase RutF